MQIKAKIKMEYNDKKQATIVKKSLDPDNEGYLTSKQEDSILLFNLEGDSLKTILATADDLIFNEITVENILQNNEESRPQNQKIQ